MSAAGYRCDNGIIRATLTSAIRLSGRVDLEARLIGVFGLNDRADAQRFVPHNRMLGHAIHKIYPTNGASVIGEIRLGQTHATGLEGVAHEISQNEMRAALV
jgi:hypothetical protein